MRARLYYRWLLWSYWPLMPWRWLRGWLSQRVQWREAVEVYGLAEMRRNRQLWQSLGYAERQAVIDLSRQQKS